MLAGKRKTGEGPVEEEKRLVKDPKAMTLLMVGVGAGFAPYAGYAWAAYEVLSKDYTGPVRVDAAQKLSTDRDPETELALVIAASNSNWKLRVAALDALAKQADPGLMDTLQASCEVRGSRRHYSTLECKRIRSSAVKHAPLGANGPGTRRYGPGKSGLQAWPYPHNVPPIHSRGFRMI